MARLQRSNHYSQHPRISRARTTRKMLHCHSLVQGQSLSTRGNLVDGRSMGAYSMAVGGLNHPAYSTWCLLIRRSRGSGWCCGCLKKKDLGASSRKARMSSAELGNNYFTPMAILHKLHPITRAHQSQASRRKQINLK